jgi:hypothetical protein
MAKQSAPAEFDAPASRTVEQNAHGALDAERNISLKDSFRLWPKAILFSFLLSLAIVMEVRNTTTQIVTRKSLMVLSTGLRYQLDGELLRLSELPAAVRQRGRW